MTQRVVLSSNCVGTDSKVLLSRYLLEQIVLVEILTVITTLVTYPLVKMYMRMEVGVEMMLEAV